ncbi:MAG: glycosyltransferase family 4 protein [Chloroflexi bacterium]|nr:glycosyltransferase family 4 protein [Chloroflexota bacterium]
MNDKHRVLYVDSAPTAGGSVVSLYELLRGLDRDRYEPIVVFYAPHAYVDHFRDLGLQVYVWDAYAAPDHRPIWVKDRRQSSIARCLRQTAWGSRLYHALGFALLLRRRVWPRARALQAIIRAESVDLVHTNIRVAHDRESIIAARLSSVPCVCHIRDWDELNWFDRRLVRMVSAFIYISESVQKRHLQTGMLRSKGHVVYNGLDVASFLAALDPVQGRKSLGLANGDLAVGIVGRLERWKGQEVFLRAMRLVEDAVPSARGIVVGDPVPYALDYRDSLFALHEEFGLSERVIFHPFRRDLPQVMSALDVVVLASTSPEPFGRVLIEAMAAGKPVVATDAGGVREIVQDGVQGLLVPPGDAAALGRAIIEVLTRPEQAAAMGRAGQARVKERFNIQQYVDGVQAVYRQLLSS